MRDHRWVIPIVRTERLLLRPWRDDDLEPFAALNADPEVMRHFPSVMNRAESDAAAARIRGGAEEIGWGLWAVELPGAAPFIGFVGLQPIPFTAPFTPAVEVGWRLARSHWNEGYATEGARAALRYGFGQLGLAEIVSMTIPDNRSSERVMQKLGMTRDPADDFDHPNLPRWDRRRHVLYRLRRADWAG